MIRQLQITNFQSHAKTEIDLAPAGVTAIVGSTDSGKTAVLRALGWVVWNRPRGKAFIRHGSCGEARVRVFLSDDVNITRVRNKQQNCYFVNGETLEALGSDVPQQVQDVLGLDDINFQRQLDGHFLVLDPPGKVASAINTAVHLQDAEQIADRLSADLRDLSRRRKDGETRQDGIEQQLKGFATLDEYETVLDEYRDLDALRSEEQDRLDELDILMNEIDDAAKAADAIRVPNVADLLDRMEVTETVRLELSTRYKALRGIVDDLNAMPEPPDTGGLDGHIAAAGHLCVDVEKLKASWGRLENLLDDLEDMSDTIAFREQDIVGLRADYAGALSELDECPVCEAELDDDGRARVLENMG